MGSLSLSFLCVCVCLCACVLCVYAHVYTCVHVYFQVKCGFLYTLCLIGCLVSRSFPLSPTILICGSESDGMRVIGFPLTVRL